MGELEGFWIRNFKSMKQVGIGACFPQFVYVDDETKVWPYPLSTTTLFAGASGSGKSTIFDAFVFVSDCFLHGVDFACQKRGGFDAIYTKGAKGSISFGFHFREKGASEAATYAVSIESSKNGTPFIESELLAYRRGKESFPIFFLQNGVKSIRYLAPDERIGAAELTKIEFTDYRHLGLAALENHPRYPVLAALRNFFENWVLNDFTPDPARGLDRSFPRRHESPRGVSLSGLVRYFVKRYGDDVDSLLGRIASCIPNVEAIDLDRSNPEKPTLAFKMHAVETPIPMTLLSAATIRMFSYTSLMEEDDPAPMIALEEPENGLDRLHCWKLTERIRRFDDFPRNSQLFATTHHPGMGDILHPAQVWILEKNRDGHTVIERACDTLLLQEAVEGDHELEPRWFSDRFEDKL